MPQTNIAASINPTEDEERISQAILNLFPEAEVTMNNEEILANSSNLEMLEEKLARQRIRDSARGVLWNCIQGKKIHFYLGKQAAFMGKVNFTEGDTVLDDLEITIETDEPEELVQRLTGTEEVESS